MSSVHYKSGQALFAFVISQKNVVPLFLTLYATFKYEESYLLTHFPLLLYMWK